MAGWNLWHGCRKISAGCQNCYVYRTDAKFGRDSSEVKKTGDFALPLKKTRAGEWKIPSGSIVYTCFTSDFLLEEADEWRGEAWDMIRMRKDLKFLFITKRIHRFMQCIPSDWGDGWDHVAVGCTCETQERADYRLSHFTDAPIKHRYIICEPLLERIDMSRYLRSSSIEQIVCGGESGTYARPCMYDWILDIRRQAAENRVSFHFKQTGANFIKDGRKYHIERKYQSAQARKAGIDLVF